MIETDKRELEKLKLDLIRFPPGTSRYERACKQLEAAVFARDNGILATTQQFGLGDMTVRAYCNSFAIKPRCMKRGPAGLTGVRRFIVLRELLKGTNGSVLAKRFGVTKQAINFLKGQAVSAGFSFPRVREL